MTLTELKAETLNEQQGSLGYMDCHKCKNKGYLAIVRDDSIVTQECECMASRRSLARIKRSGLADMVENNKFETYQTIEDWQKVAKRMAINYTADGNGKWFVITGTPGTGKTHLCTAIAGELIEAGKEVRYMLWRTEAPRLKSLVNERDEYERIMLELKRVDVLYIDDFFKGTISAADINLAFELLDARYNSRDKMTIISSEKTMEDILSIDEAIGSRIYERSKGFCIKTPVQNWRLR